MGNVCLNILKTKKFTYLFYNKIAPPNKQFGNDFCISSQKAKAVPKNSRLQTKKGKNALRFVVLKIYGKAIGLRFWK